MQAWDGSKEGGGGRGVVRARCVGPSYQQAAVNRLPPPSPLPPGGVESHTARLAACTPTHACLLMPCGGLRRMVTCSVASTGGNGGRLRLAMHVHCPHIAAVCVHSSLVCTLPLPPTSPSSCCSTPADALVASIPRAGRRWPRSCACGCRLRLPRSSGQLPPACARPEVLHSGWFIALCCPTPSRRFEARRRQRRVLMQKRSAYDWHPSHCVAGSQMVTSCDCS